MLIECFCGCRNKIEQSCAYKIILGGTRKVYFLNEQHYLRWQDKNSAKSNKIDERRQRLPYFQSASGPSAQGSRRQQ